MGIASLNPSYGVCVARAAGWVEPQAIPIGAIPAMAGSMGLGDWGEERWVSLRSTYPTGGCGGGGQAAGGATPGW